MFEAAAILFSIGIFIFCYFINKDIFYPPALFSLLWTVILIIYVAFMLVNKATLEYLVDYRCLLVFVLGQLAFCTGSLFATNRSLKEKIKNQQPALKYRFDKFVFIFLLLLLPVYVYKLMSIVNASSVTDVGFFIALRYEITSGESPLGALQYLNTFALFGFGVALYKFNYTGFNDKPILNKIYKYTFYLIVLAYTVLSTARTILLLLFCIYLGFRLMKQGLSKKFLIILLTCAVLVFAIYAFVLHKGGGEFYSVEQNVENISNSLVSYLLGGVYAFNTVITNNIVPEYGANSFRFFVALMNAAGITDMEPKSTITPFIYTPIMSNVYSVYYVYFKDFWYFGIAFLGLFGYLHTRFYYRAKRDFFNLFMYSVLLYPLLMSFFQDQYFTLLSQWIQLIIFACIALPFIEYKKNPEDQPAT